MRLLCLLLLMTACTASAPAPPPAEPSGADLGAAVAAWQAEPDQANLDAVSLAAAEAAAQPPGDRERDLVLGTALADVLMRPDLAVPRLRPIAPTLTPDEADPWLNALLRSGELEQLSRETSRIHGRAPMNPAQEGLLAAAAQARIHRSITWRSAARAHDASALASRQVTYDRGQLDRPVRSLPDAVRTLQAVLPEWRVALVTTRSLAANEPAAATTVGAIPANRGSRRVLDYADGRDPAAVVAIAESLVARPRARVVGLVLGATHPDGRSLTVCGEGRIQDERLWLSSGCGPERETAWLDAAELWFDLTEAGVAPDDRAAQLARRFASAVEGAD